ncbi:MAG: UDP-N-acetylmuramate:L-alanyl-gamma-D-glutamyl-meso-diaminopimelate ligase [Desulfobacteraceae bacterium]|nr:UDP-N-acetylmuramate:L-alanyl-gamma-D-glutamyl-meso-diaminopimelate ligase [Desulfobacteraceae bacterium]
MPSSHSSPPPLLDPALNRFPEHVRRIHLMGICGTGMGALAGMLKAAGYEVTGSDQHVYPPMSDFLAASGIPVAEGYKAANLEPRPDLVVVGNVITRQNPEAQALAAAAIPYLSFPQTLSRCFILGKMSLVVAGTHGKTTTSSLLATLLHTAGLAPSFMIGGLVQAFGRNYTLGDGPHFVAEGDEYDTAFFDKGPKFLHYRPHIVILTSIELDHVDIYRDLEAVKTSFRRLVAIMPPDGCLVACLDDPVVAEVTAAAPCPVLGYGLGPRLAWRLADLDIAPGATSFTVLKEGMDYGRFSSILPGRHNALNALAVIAVLDRLGVGREPIAAGLRSFAGVKRRQEVRGTVRGVTVIDDFAHHPTAVRETLAALRAAYAGRRLVAVFDPRTNTSRRKVFQQAYVEAFDDADLVLVREPEGMDKIPEAERFSAAQLVADLVRRGRAARYFTDTEGVLGFLRQAAAAGDVVAILSNGGFDNIHNRLLALLQSG